MIFPKGTLRVVSPVTEDGSRPKYDEQGRQVYKETFLPKTAKRAMERQNANKPNHLKKKIEVLAEDYVEPTQGAQPVVAEKPKVKPGPKPRTNAQTN